MICALLIDPDDSPDFPGNTAEVLGRPLAAFPLMAAKGSSHVHRVYALTASPPVARVAAQFAAITLMPPRVDDEQKPSDEALIADGYRQIVDDLQRENAQLELLVVVFANTGAVNTPLIDEGVQALLDDPAIDSAVTVSSYERWNPRRALRENAAGRMEPYAECKDGSGTPWFPDWGAVVARPRLLNALNPASPPLAHLGHNIKPLKQLGGGPVDRPWQVPKMEYWLKKQGMRESHRPEPMPKLQPSPKPLPKTDRR